MHPAPQSPLGQALAAIIALLIAALAEHAAEHPMLAPGLRASIRRLEKLSKQLRAMAAEWEAHQTSPASRAGTRPPPRASTPRTTRKGRSEPAPARRPAAMRNRATAARAPPAPTRPTPCPAPPELPRTPSGWEPQPCVRA